MTSAVLDGNPETPRRLQELARHQFISNMLADILIDMTVCELEGWNKMEYIQQIYEEIAAFVKKTQRDTR